VVLLGVNARAPTSSRPHGDSRSSESVGDGLRVDSESVGDVGQRQSGRVQLGGFLEGLIVPDGLFVVAWDAAAVEVGGHGGAVDVELRGELADGGADLVGRDEVVDVGGGEASLRRV
jgi:hypothetical protein